MAGGGGTVGNSMLIHYQVDPESWYIRGRFMVLAIWLMIQPWCGHGFSDLTHDTTMMWSWF